MAVLRVGLCAALMCAACTAQGPAPELFHYALEGDFIDRHGRLSGTESFTALEGYCGMGLYVRPGDYHAAIERPPYDRVPQKNDPWTLSFFVRVLPDGRGRAQHTFVHIGGHAIGRPSRQGVSIGMDAHNALTIDVQDPHMPPIATHVAVPIDEWAGFEVTYATVNAMHNGVLKLLKREKDGSLTTVFKRHMKSSLDLVAYQLGHGSALGTISFGRPNRHDAHEWAQDAPYIIDEVVLHRSSASYIDPFCKTPLPPTSAPSTLTPQTPMPQTQSPPSPVPPTPVPPTPAPSATMIPPTSSPTTPLPATPVPPTHAPQTNRPPTPPPPTQSPPTPVPRTGSPPTPLPATPLPPTPLPSTPVPHTLSPPTQSPPTQSPPSPLPPTPPPRTKAPATLVPTTPSPPTPAPSSPSPPTAQPATMIPPTPSPAQSTPLPPAPATQSPPNLPPPTHVPPTNAPSTPGPPTPLPPTPAPATGAPSSPATGNPPTPIPSTPRPQPPSRAPVAQTHAPPTASPQTMPPDTPSPATGAPVTASPATPSPPTATRIPVKPRSARAAPLTPSPTAVPLLALTDGDKGVVEGAATAATAGGIVGAVFGGHVPAAAGNGGKIALLKGFGCEVDDIDLGGEPLDWEFHPLQVALGAPDSRHRYLVAAAMLNPLLLCAFVAVFGAATTVLRGTCYSTWDEALAHTRCPGLLFIPSLFLMTGTSLAGAQLTFDSQGETAATVLGVAVLLVCIVAPFLLWRVVLHPVRANAALLQDPRLSNPEVDGKAPLLGWRRTLYVAAFGNRVWVSRNGSRFCEQYGVVFETVKADALWYVVFELVHIVALSLLSAWKPDGGGMECNTRNSLILLVCGAVLFVLCYVRPYLAAVENAICILIAAATFVAVLLMTVAIWMSSGGNHEDGRLMHVSAMLLVASGYLVMAKALWDLGGYIYDMLVGRRSTARKKARDADGAVELEMAAPIADESLSGFDYAYECTPASHRTRQASCSSSILSVSSLHSPVTTSRRTRSEVFDSQSTPRPQFPVVPLSKRGRRDGSPLLVECDVDVSSSADALDTPTASRTVPALASVRMLRRVESVTLAHMSVLSPTQRADPMPRAPPRRGRAGGLSSPMYTDTSGALRSVRFLVTGRCGAPRWAGTGVDGDPVSPTYLDSASLKTHAPRRGHLSGHIFSNSHT